MIRILTGDCLDVLRTLPAASVHCCVTSPPYYGLRDYGTATWDGGEAGCDHAKGTAASIKSTLKNDGREKFGSSDYEHSIVVPYRHICGKCGARRVDSQIGLEETPDAYVAKLVAVFREVRRVLRDDGILFLNIGDSYAGGGGFSPTAPSNLAGSKQTTQGGAKPGGIKPGNGIKPKDLIGIPWLLAFALRADGWYLRQDIIWAKPNPMPESVRDRCTKAHEYVFLLSKQARYFYDAEAIAEAVTREFWTETVGAKYMTAKDGRMDGGKREGNGPMDGTRNKRSVWTIATQPYAEAHFATFPPELAETCIKAGCPAGGMVLDPFGGAGTTGLVADRLQRSAILIELNPGYAEMSRRRVADDAGLFAEMTA